MSRPRRFCDNQIVCREDGAESYTCAGHLDEGRAFECPYKEADIKVADELGTKQYRFIIQKNSQPNADGVCRDFEITPQVKKTLISRVVSELSKS